MLDIKAGSLPSLIWFPLLLYFFLSLLYLFISLVRVIKQLQTNCSFLKMATGYQVPDSNDVCEDGILTFDWEDCETRQIVKAFPMSDYGTNSDQSSIEYLVNEPSSISGIKDSTISIPRPHHRTISEVEEYYVEDDMSSLTNISAIQVSTALRKHEFGKERVEREGNIYAKLYNACLKGELNTINDILQKHSTLMQDADGQTPLFAACIGDYKEIVKRLTDFGYDVNHQDKEGKTPLHVTFENHVPDLAESLITQLKANTEIRDKQNWTPLHTAIDRGYYQYSWELLQRFLHLDVDTEVSWIQLHAASFAENKQDVQLLLDAGTDVNHVSSTGHTPLLIAVIKRNIDLVTLLLDKGVNINCVTIDGKTPLHIAVDNDDEVIIQKLLAQNADPLLKDAPGNTSLHLAVKIKQETVSNLVEAGASHMNHFPTPYHTCSIPTVEAIIEHGADVNAVNNKGQSPLWFACADGQESFVKILLDTGAEPNIADKNEDSCLHAAISGQCSTETIQKLIDHGARVNAVNKDGATPLLLACGIAHSTAVALLLKAKADPNIADGDGDTSLHAATTANCSDETLQEVIDYGADVNAVNKRGRSTLLLSCFYRHMDSVKILLKAGADPTIADEEGFSCLHAAIDGRCSTDILQALIHHGAHIDAARKDGTNAFLRACTTGQSESARFLVEAGADVSITKPDGNASLHIAVEGKCSIATLQKIIEKGVNVNKANNRGETALLLTCDSAQADSVKLLLKEGANPNIHEGEGNTSLHAAVLGCCTDEILLEIIRHKVQLDARNVHGQTSLLLACSYRRQNFIKILLQAGSNPNIADNHGDTCLHATITGGCSKWIIHTLIENGADVNAANKENVTALMIACGNGRAGTINVFLDAGADPNITDAYGYTCLSYANYGKCRKDDLQAIIDHGVDVNATSKQNKTALMWACEKGNVHAINVMLNAGANPNTADANGDTCLFKAISARCNKQALQALIDHGADVNVINKSGRTALMHACQKGNKDAINVLLNAGADTTISDTNDYTCLHKAVNAGCNKQTLQALIDHGADVYAVSKVGQTALKVACKKGNVDAINVLQNAKEDPHIVDDDCHICFGVAVRGGYSKEVLQALINHGADANAIGKTNTTALMHACQQGKEDVVNILLNAGADTTISDPNGDTCLFKAISTGCKKQTLQALIDHGADVNATSRVGQTALKVACEKGNVDAINVLQNAKEDPHDNDLKRCYSVATRGDYNREVLQALINHGAQLWNVKRILRWIRLYNFLVVDLVAVIVVFLGLLGSCYYFTDKLNVDQKCVINAVLAAVAFGMGLFLCFFCVIFPCRSQSR